MAARKKGVAKKRSAAGKAAARKKGTARSGSARKTSSGRSGGARAARPAASASGGIVYSDPRREALARGIGRLLR